MVIRAASPADLDVLVELDRVCFARPWTRLQWQQELEGSESLRPLVLLALDDDDAIAYASAPVLACEGTCELRRIAVLARMRRHHVGGDLIARVIDHVRKMGCLRVQLEVASTNHPAIALYRRMGFHTVGLRPRYYRDPPADALLMDLEITAESPF